MNYCQYCGKPLVDGATFCSACGSAVRSTGNTAPAEDPETLIQSLSAKVQANGIIWICIACVQLLLGIFYNWILLIVGMLNLVSGINDLSYSKSVLTNRAGIVGRFEPLTAPIITLVYNLVFGGVIGVAGSLYYLIAIRNFVLSHRNTFAQYDRVGTKI